MTAPDDLARTLAKQLAMLDEYYDAFAKGDLYSHPVNVATRRDYMRKGKHLASVVSRRDTDLRTRIEAALSTRVTPTLGTAKWAADPLPSCPNYAHVNPEWLLELIAEAEAVRAALDGDTREDAARGGRVDQALRQARLAAASRVPADTDTGRGQ